jgi:hypothetical protein
LEIGMKAIVKRFVCQILALSLIGIPFTVQASIISTDEVLAQVQTQSDRTKVRDFVARADVQTQLQDHGLSLTVAQERVDAMTDSEVQQIAGKIDTLPAGAGAVSTVAIVAATIIVIYIILQHFYPK